MNINFFHSKRLTLMRHLRDLLKIIITSFWRKQNEVVSFEEQKQRDIFIRVFSSTKFKDVQQMYDSIRLRWSKNKIVKIDEYYKLNLDSPVDRWYSFSPSIKRMTETAKNFCKDAITHNSNLSSERLLIYFLSLN